MAQLLREGYACSSIDITRIGVDNISPEKWYYTICKNIQSNLKIELDLLTWWNSDKPTTPVYKFFTFIREIVLEQIKGSIVIFFDEIDSILKLDRNEFNTDDFFGLIRTIYNERADNPEFARLNIVIIGVASPTELMKDPDRTPFNIGKSISLTNFNIREAEVLKEGLMDLNYDPDELLNEIFFWTNGQPVLTQQLCLSISSGDHTTGTVKELVKKHVDGNFLRNAITEAKNNNLLNIQTRILRNERYGMAMLQLYASILKLDKVKIDTGEIAQTFLMLTGLVSRDDEFLVVNNNIYKSKLNLAWISDLASLMNRPFNANLKEWLDSGKSPEKVLQGQALEEYNNWCNSRSDLTIQEKEFLTFSYNTQVRKELEAKVIEERQLLEIQKQKALEEERKLKAEQRQLIDSERKKLRARNLTIILLVAACITLPFFLLFSYKENKKAKIELLGVKHNIKIIVDSLANAGNELRELNGERDYLIVEKGKILMDRQKTMQEKELLTKQIDILEFDKERAIQEKQQEIYDIKQTLYIVQDSVQSFRKKLLSLDKYYTFKTDNPWIYYFSDTALRSKIILKIFSSDDDLTRRKLIETYKQLALAERSKRNNTNRALYLITDILKSNLKDSIINSSLSNLINNYVFYSKTSDLNVGTGNSLSFDTSSFYNDGQRIQKIDNNIISLLDGGNLKVIDISTLKERNILRSGRGLLNLNCFYYSKKSKLFFCISKATELIAVDIEGNVKMKIKMPIKLPVYSFLQIVGADKNSIYFINGPYYSASNITKYNYKNNIVNNIDISRLNSFAVQKGKQYLKKSKTYDDWELSNISYDEAENIFYLEYEQFLETNKIVVASDTSWTPVNLIKNIEGNTSAPTRTVCNTSIKRFLVPLGLEATSLNGGKIYKWGLYDYEGNKLAEVELEKNGDVLNFTTSPDEKYLLINEGDNYMVCDISSKKSKTIPYSFFKYIDVNDSYIITIDSNNNLKFWDYKNETLDLTLLERRYVLPFRKEFEDDLK